MVGAWPAAAPQSVVVVVVKFSSLFSSYSSTGSVPSAVTTDRDMKVVNDTKDPDTVNVERLFTEAAEEGTVS